MKDLEVFSDDLWMNVNDEVQNFLTEKDLLLTDEETEELATRISNTVDEIIEDHYGENDDDGGTQAEVSGGQGDFVSPALALVVNE